MDRQEEDGSNMADGSGANQANENVPGAADNAGDGDQIEQQDGESQAGSDVAVAAAPARARQREQRANRGGDAVEPRRRPGPNVTYPQPRNFAERLMGAMQANLAPDCISWAGNGTAVALHRKNLKRGTVLHEHFHIANFGAFIRNFNRWGFKRVAHHEVPPGMITYENSLFRRDEPHLVKHMRMDSDVQDVYRRERALAEGEREGQVPESVTVAQAGDQPRSSNPSSGNSQNASIAGLQPHQQQLSDWLNGNGWNTQGPAPELPPPLQLHQRGAAPAPAPPQPQMPPQVSLQVPPNQVHHAEPESEALVNTLASVLQQAIGQNASPQATNANTMVRDSLFSQILRLAQQYLDLSASNNTGEASVLLILKLILVFGRQMQQTRQAQPHVQPSAPLQQPLLQAFLSAQNQAQVAAPNALQAAIQAIQSVSGNSGQVLQQLLPSQLFAALSPPPAAAAPAPQSNAVDSSTNTLLQVLIQREQQQQQQPQVQQQPQLQVSLANLGAQRGQYQPQSVVDVAAQLLQHGQPTHQQQAQPQQQPQHNSAGQQSQQLQDLLLMLAQAQPRQQNNDSRN